MNEADAPPQAVRLAAGELLLRIGEERRRRAAGLGCAAGIIPQRRMVGKAGELLEVFFETTCCTAQACLGSDLRLRYVRLARPLCQWA